MKIILIFAPQIRDACSFLILVTDDLLEKYNTVKGQFSEKMTLSTGGQLNFRYFKFDVKICKNQKF
jgi:hypothetical protein